MMRVQVEQKLALDTNKIVRGGWPAAACAWCVRTEQGRGTAFSLKFHLPSDAGGLGHLKGCDECLPVYRGDLVDPQAGPDENERRMKFATVRLCNLHEAVLVDIGAVAS